MTIASNVTFPHHSVSVIIVFAKILCSHQLFRNCNVYTLVYLSVRHLFVVDGMKWIIGRCQNILCWNVDLYWQHLWLWKWSLFIANHVHLLLDFEIILLQIFKTEGLDKIRKETILYIVCEILKLSMFYSLTCDIVVRFW